MYILVKEHKIIGAEKGTASSVNYDKYEPCLRDFYRRLGDCVDDTTVAECRVLILNGEHMPVKCDKFIRQVEEIPVEEEPISE